MSLEYGDHKRMPQDSRYFNHCLLECYGSNLNNHLQRDIVTETENASELSGIEASETVVGWKPDIAGDPFGARRPRHAFHLTIDSIRYV